MEAAKRITKKLAGYKAKVAAELKGEPMGDVSAMGAGSENDGPVEVAAERLEVENAGA